MRVRVWYDMVCWSAIYDFVRKLSALGSSMVVMWVRYFLPPPLKRDLTFFFVVSIFFFL